MAAKKNLGMGLDLLLSAAETKKQLESMEEAQRLFAMAIDFDEEGNCLEAYYYYRKMIDDFSHLENQGEIAMMLSQAFNNAAIILYDNGCTKMAMEYLQQALAISPHNPVAEENLELIRQENI